MAVFARVFHISPPDYWRLRLDEVAALHRVLGEMARQQKGNR